MFTNLRNCLFLFKVTFLFYKLPVYLLLRYYTITEFFLFTFLGLKETFLNCSIISVAEPPPFGKLQLRKFEVPGPTPTAAPTKLGRLRLHRLKFVILSS